jgi:transcriptional regulator of arginine metabolism
LSKRVRHQKILKVLKLHRVTNQEGLKELLRVEGTEVTQATLSRDMRELRIVKVTGADGTPHYSSPDEWESTPALASLLPALFQSAEGIGQLLVVKTLKGGAQTVAAGIDWEEWPEILGTLAGDDTILVVLRDPQGLSSVQQRIEGMAGR